MKCFTIADTEGIRTIKMNRGKGNPINHEFTNELTDIIKESQQNEAVKGVLLTGKEHFFSVGLDLIELYEYSDSKYDQFWEAFMTMVYIIASFDKPLVASITGHAPAGGCVISICADYRVMAEGPYKIGLNEVPVGIIIPPSVYQLYSFWLGARAASQFILEGKLHTVKEARNVGLVDEIATLETVEEVALSKLKTYLSLNQDAWRASKRTIRENLLHQLVPKRDQHFKDAQAQWWKPEVRTALKAYIDRFKKK